MNFEMNFPGEGFFHNRFSNAIYAALSTASYPVYYLSALGTLKVTENDFKMGMKFLEADLRRSY